MQSVIVMDTTMMVTLWGWNFPGGLDLVAQVTLADSVEVVVVALAVEAEAVDLKAGVVVVVEEVDPLHADLSTGSWCQVSFNKFYAFSLIF